MPRAKIQFHPLEIVVGAEPSTPGQRAIAALLCPSIEPDELVAQAISNQRAMLHLAAQHWLHRRYGHPPRASLPRDIRPIIAALADVLEGERRAATEMTTLLRAEGADHPYSNEWEWLADHWRSRRTLDREATRAYLVSPDWSAKGDGLSSLAHAIAQLDNEDEQAFDEQPFYAILLHLTKRGLIPRSVQRDLRKAWAQFHRLATRSPMIQHPKIVNGQLAYRGRGGRVQAIKKKGIAEPLRGKGLRGKSAFDPKTENRETMGK